MKQKEEKIAPPTGSPRFRTCDVRGKHVRLEQIFASLPNVLALAHGSSGLPLVTELVALWN